MTYQNVEVKSGYDVSTVALSVSFYCDDNLALCSVPSVQFLLVAYEVSLYFLWTTSTSPLFGELHDRFGVDMGC